MLSAALLTALDHISAKPEYHLHSNWFSKDMINLILGVVAWALWAKQNQQDFDARAMFKRCLLDSSSIELYLQHRDNPIVIQDAKANVPSTQNRSIQDSSVKGLTQC